MKSSMPSTAITGSVQQSGQRNMDELVGYLLLAGVLLSIALLTVGLVWHYIDTGAVSFDYRIGGMNLYQFVVSEIRLAASAQLRPRLLINMGIAVLMLTPFFRVLASVVYFGFALKNWKYTVFTCFVLAVLTYSLFLR